MRSEPHQVPVGTATVPPGWSGGTRRGARRRLRRLTGLLTATLSATLVATGLVGVPGVPTAAPAAADTAPTEPGNPATIAADALPTVQIDGIAWSQVVVGGTVYVAGKFTTARPAGAAAGTSTVPRANLLAYDLATGALVSSWDTRLNGPAYAIAASPDGTRLYVGGEFTAVDGVAHERFVTLDRATGNRVGGFAGHKINGAVKAIAATASAVYVGGSFNTVGVASRPRLAAFNPGTGALLGWRVTADYPVEAMVMSPDNSRVIVGGRFTNLSGTQARGSGAVHPTTGAVLPWAVNKVVTNYGWDAGITSLTTDGTLVYGSGFVHLTSTAGGHGNLEGIYAADPATGAIRWIEDCHGDTYSVHPNRGKDHVYGAGHPHACANIGGFADSPWRPVLAFTKQAVSTITPNKDPKYFNFAGHPAPRLLHFFPDMTPGTQTTAKQMAWHVTGSGEYLVLGGEFTAVNGKPQQGLVRMATSAVAPDRVGPAVTGTTLQPAATSEAAGTAQVSWPTNWDRDNSTLSYEVLRGSSTIPIYTVKAPSSFWERPRLSFTDTGLGAGQTHTYRVVARDPFGNATTSPPVSVVVAGTSKGALSAYAKEILLDNPHAYWRLGEASGAAQDWTGHADLTVGTTTGRGVAGALANDTNKAMRFGGASTSRVYGGKFGVGLNRFSVEAWFRTSSSAGGKIVGWGSSSAASSSTAYDRHLYVGTDGRLTFGANPNDRRVLTTSGPVNDGRWHHAVGTLGPSGMRLYVDGVLQGERTDTIGAEASSAGYWRIGGDAVAGWPAAGSQDFVGDIDEVAVYGRVLTATEVGAHRALGGTVGGGGTTTPNASPTASFTASTSALRVDVDASGSSDPDGTVTGWSWAFGDGTTATGRTASRTYAQAGTYPVALTVTDDDGARATTSRQVTVTSGTTTTPTTVARDAFGRTVTAGWGSADLGGAWTTPSATGSVSGGAGLLRLGSAGASGSARLPGVTGTALTTQATARWDARPAGAGGWWMVRGRITSAGEYRLKIAHRADGVVTARLVRSTAAGAETALTGEVTLAGLTYSAGTGVVGELELVGTTPTTLRGRVWAAGQARPSAALLSATDTTTGLQVAGHTGLAGLLSSTSTNAPVTVRFDDFAVVRAG